MPLQRYYHGGILSFIGAQLMLNGFNRLIFGKGDNPLAVRGCVSNDTQKNAPQYYSFHVLK